jgi:hypothetical protein
MRVKNFSLTPLTHYRTKFRGFLGEAERGYHSPSYGGHKSTSVQLNGYEASWLGQGDGSKEYDLSSV